MKEEYLEIYSAAKEYLIHMLPDNMNESDLQKYFVGDRRDFNTLKDVFEQLIYSAQNYQSMPNIIKYEQRQEEIRSILKNFDIEEIQKMDADELYYDFREKFQVTSKDSKYNGWYKWSKSVIDSARFMGNFKDVSDFKGFVSQFDYNLLTRMALPQLISSKISGIGFALACDCLKELGYLNYPKPDVHLIEVFSQLGMSEEDPISVFETIVEMAEVCQENDCTVTPYKIDKVFWLICSGRFYLDDISVGRHKDEFIQNMLKRS